MKNKEDLNFACKCAELLFCYLPKSCVDDIILYGGLARGEETKDIDLIIIGNVDFLNKENEEILISNSIKFSKKGRDRLNRLVCSSFLLKSSKVGKEIDLGIINSSFFSNLEYRINFFKNLKNYDPLFFYNFLNDGLIYDGEKEEFNIGAKSKYNDIIKKSIKDRHSYFGVKGY